MPRDSYELMYGTGGHGGPYWSLADATASAKRHLRGCASEDRVYIVPRDKRTFDRANAVQIITRGDLAENTANQ